VPGGKLCRNDVRQGIGQKKTKEWDAGGEATSRSSRSGKQQRKGRTSKKMDRGGGGEAQGGTGIRAAYSFRAEAQKDQDPRRIRKKKEGGCSY